MNASAVHFSRYVLGFCWIYQGFFPKLFVVAPLEKVLTAAMGFSPSISNLITRSAGVGEIIFGVLLIVFYTNKVIHSLNIAALLGLLIYVAIMVPALLVEAFNPVTTNLTMIALSVVILSAKKADQT